FRGDGAADGSGANGDDRRRVRGALLSSRQTRFRSDYPGTSRTRGSDVAHGRDAPGGQRRDAGLAFRGGSRPGDRHTGERAGAQNPPVLRAQRLMHAAVDAGSAEALAGRMLRLVQGYRASCVIATAVKLGLLDQLNAGPMSVDELAKRLRAHGSSLRRFLNALEALGFVESQGSGVRLAQAGRLLVDPESGLRERAILSAEEYIPAWVKLGESVMTGEPAFPAAFGMNVWEHRKAHPELDESFNRAMADLQARARSSVLDMYDFSSCGLVVDVGGGSGALIADILQRYPDATGLVFDQPHVVVRAQAVLAAAGVLDRCH